MAEEVSIRQIPLDRELEWPICHDSGHTLFEKGQIVTEAIVELLREAGIRRVYLLNHYKDKGARFREQRRLREVNVLGLGENDVICQAVYSSAGSLVVPTGARITPEYSAALRMNGTEKVFVNRSARELKITQVTAFRRLHKKHQRMLKRGSGAIEDAAPAAPTAAEAFAHRLRQAARTNTAAQTRIPRSTRSAPRPVHGAASDEDLALEPKVAAIFYRALAQQCEELFAALRDRPMNDGTRVAEFSQECMKAALAQPGILAAVTRMKQRGDFLFTHSLNVATLSLNIAATMSWDTQRCRALGIAAFLHDLGMIAVKPEILDKKGPLSSDEEAEIRKHPAYTYKVLQQVPEFEAVIAPAVFQEHERMDGSGYPRGLSGGAIHEFARVIAIADVFEALCHPRPHRSRVVPAKAVETLLRLTRAGQLDKDCLRALLSCIGLFPLCSLVALEDGRVAKVKTSNPGALDKPVIMLLPKGNGGGGNGTGNGNGTGGGNGNVAHEIDLSLDISVKIARPLSFEECDPSVLRCFA